jgi:phage terminase small subunit
MGQRGPKPLPKNVLALRGSWRANVGPQDGTVTPDIEIPGCPKHLLPEARKEWKRITPLLEGLGLIAKIDRAALSLYCQEWAWWVWHDDALQRAVKIAAEKRAAWEAKRNESTERGVELTDGAEWTGGDGFMIPTPNGNLTYSPHWVARNKAADRVDKFLASFGMSPSARGRVTASNRTGYLPGMEPKGGFDAL